MNKEEFNALVLEQQVQYINDCLQETSLAKIGKSIGIDESTIRTRFNSNGYFRASKEDDKKRRFIASGDTVNTLNTSNIHNTKDTNNTGNTSKAKRQSNNNSNIKALENRVYSLEKELEQLKEIVLSNTKNTNNTIGITNIDNDSNTREIIKYKSNNLVSRNYKIDKDVAEQFVKFCKVQKLTNDYKVSDLATNALVEYMEKFKK